MGDNKRLTTLLPMALIPCVIASGDATQMFDAELSVPQVPGSTFSSKCEDWCMDRCSALNGDVSQECGGCSKAEGVMCYPGAEGFDTWQERATERRMAAAAGVEQGMQVSVEAIGEVTAETNPDAPIEVTHKSVVYAEKYHVIAERNRNRSNVNLSAPEYAEWVLTDTLPVPGASPRECGVHSCVLIEGDEACAEGLPECDGPLGHLRPFGEQWETLTPVPEHSAAEFDGPAFWREAMSQYQPVLVRGAAAAATPLSEWSHEAMLHRRARGR
jgi:hypothetical protein